MNRQNKQSGEYRRLVQHILEMCPSATAAEAKEIARRMMEQPEGDLLDIMTM